MVARANRLHHRWWTATALASTTSKLDGIESREERQSTDWTIRIKRWGIEARCNTGRNKQAGWLDFMEALQRFPKSQVET